LAQQSATRGATEARTLELPPFYRAINLREHQDAFDHARSIAAEAGAGTLVWVRRFDTIEFALIVEPDEPLSAARRVLYAAMSALGDALVTYAPPEKPMAFAWPATIMFDGGIIGGGQLAWPDGATEDDVPDWLVVGFVVRGVLPAKTGGTHQFDTTAVRGTSLEAEGFEMLDQADVVASFARHFMVYVDQWQEKGFVPVGQTYLARLPEERGVKRGIDVNGDLLVRRLPNLKEVERQSLVAALAAPEWRDPETGDPWL